MSIKTSPDSEYPPLQTALPYVGAIIEKKTKNGTELLVQTRWKPHKNSIYNGTIEFPAGVLDILYENIYDTLSREIHEETGLELESVISNNQTEIFSPQDSDQVFGFKPFCCTQQLKDGKPWIGFIFLCRVKSGKIKAQKGETKDVRWINRKKLKKLFIENQEKFFALEVPAWHYYFEIEH